MKDYSLPNISIFHDCIEKVIEPIFANIFVKDKKGIYLDVNDVFLKTSGNPACEDIIGKTDLDLCWNEQAPLMMRNDQEVISRKCKKIYIESAKSPVSNIILDYLNYKAPLCSKTKKIIGTLGFSFPINRGNSISAALDEFSILVENYFTNHRNETYFSAKNNESATELTKRQLSCLYYLVRGMTVKQIAKALKLSPKTVEHYLETIKKKLNCYNRVELITKALQLPLIRETLNNS